MRTFAGAEQGLLLPVPGLASALIGLVMVVGSAAAKGQVVGLGLCERARGAGPLPYQGALTGSPYRIKPLPVTFNPFFL